MRFVGCVVNAFDPCLLSGEFVQFIEDQKLILDIPPLFEDILSIFIEIPVEVSS